MAIFNNYPYTDFYNLNLEWILRAIKEYLAKVDALEINYNDLKNYVINYFDNLDVQDEINNKLDEMAESGELIEIIAQYLDTQTFFIYNTVNDLKNAENLQDKMNACVLGRDLYNDGLTHNYKIREMTNTDIVDDYTIIALINYPNLIAELIVDKVKNVVSVAEYGAIGDGITDDSRALQLAIDNANIINLVGGKNYLINTTLILKNNTIINLNNATITCNTGKLFHNFTSQDTEILAYNGAGNIIIKNGTLINGRMAFIHSHDVLLENITFKDCESDHFIEICACKNFSVNNCRFIGMKYVTTSVREYINIDFCRAGAFPWLPSDSTTYDGTPNYNLTFRGCYFAPNFDNTNYAYIQTAIGSHGIDEVKNKNIIIDNCYIDGNEDTIWPISAYCMENVKVTNNTTRGIYGIRTRAVDGLEVADNNFINITNQIRVGVVFGTDNDLLNISIYNNAVKNRSSILGSLTNPNVNYSFNKVDLDMQWTGSEPPANSISLPIPITSFNTLRYTYGAPGSNSYMTQKIFSFYSRNFTSGEKFPVILPNGSIGKVVITDDYTISFEDNTSFNTRVIEIGNERTYKP